MPLHISVSSLEDFLNCKRLYYYKRIKKYEKIEFSIPFIVGRTVHVGMGHLLAKNPKAMELMGQHFKDEKKLVSKTYTLTPEQIEKLNEQELITKAMLAAYRRRYAKMLNDVEQVKSEREGAVQFGDDVVFVIKMDNVFRVRNKKILHELKSSKNITPEYVRRIHTNFQVAAYYYFYNIIFPESPIEEVMYDIIRKPSIRQKQKESRQEYLNRLIEWYKRPDDMAVFHIERFTQPKISQDSIINTVDKVANEMLGCKDKDDYYQNFDKCLSYYGTVCPYVELCHEGGETKENMLLYQIRKSYHVDTTNTFADED